MCRFLKDCVGRGQIRFRIRVKLRSRKEVISRDGDNDIHIFLV